MILLSIDTLRADHVSAYGYHRETTPELDRWIRRHGVVFENTVAPSPWTIPSHASMFTGLDALEHGTNYKLPILPDHMLLTEYLRDAGYHTIAFTGGAFLHPDFGIAQGFDIFRYWPGGVAQTEELASNVDAAVQWIESAPAEPFFLFFHTYEVHAPFEARQPFLARLSPSAPESTISIATRSQERTVEDGFTVVKRFVHIHGAVKRPEPLSEHETQMAIDLYDSGIAYMDSKIGYLLRSLENTGLARQTVVVLTSDHGDALGEKGLAAHSYLYDFNLMIPLMIAAPGRAEAGRRVQDQVRLIDVVPTILELARVEVPRDISGISLVPFLNGGKAALPGEAWSYAASTNYGLSLRMSNRLKYIYNNTAWNTIHGSEELYQLQSDRDENDNRATEDPETANLRNKVLARFREDATGLHIRFRNPSSASIPCRLTGKHLIHPYRLKINGPACSYVTYKQRGEAEVDMHAGADFTLFAEGVDLGRIGLDLGCKNGEQPAYSLRMRLSELSQSPKAVAFLDQKWVEITPPLRDEVPTVTISWHGTQVSSSLAENTGGQNQSLQQQLEALGYVE